MVLTSDFSNGRREMCPFRNPSTGDAGSGNSHKLITFHFSISMQVSDNFTFWLVYEKSQSNGQSNDVPATLKRNFHE